MRRYSKSWPPLIVPSPAIILPLPVNRFHNELLAKVPDNIPRNNLFFFPFVFFLL